MCNVAGWASDRLLFERNAQPLNQLHKSWLPLVDRRTCLSSLSSKPDSGDISIEEDRLCTGYTQGSSDDCRLDMGAPLVCKSQWDNTYYLHGINSFGYGFVFLSLFFTNQHFETVYFPIDVDQKEVIIEFFPDLALLCHGSSTSPGST